MASNDMPASASSKAMAGADSSPPTQSLQPRRNNGADNRLSEHVAAPVAMPLRATCQKKYIAEAIGAFAIVFLGTGAIIVDQETHGIITHVGIAVSFGLAVMAMIHVLKDTSGAHFNQKVYAYDEVPVTSSIKLEINSVKPVKSVVLQPEGTQLPFRQDNGKVVV